MVKKFLKSKSKRLSASKRYKIERKVREHNRKIKKSDKAKSKFRKAKKKIINVPGDCPFKETILKEAIAVRENIAESKKTRLVEQKAARKSKRDEILASKRGLTGTKIIGTAKSSENGGAAPVPAPVNFSDLLKKAEERGYHFEQINQKKGSAQSHGFGPVDSSLKAFYKEFQTVIAESDIIIQVLDARDPLGSRSLEAEEIVRGQIDKKLILVLNKCDLVPVDNLQKWIDWLKNSAGCSVLPFKSNTQKQKDRFGSVSVVNTNSQASTLDTKKSVGAGDLLGLLGNWARGSAGGLTVGVIGMPNVGKSSLINSLKRSKACNVGAKAGVTRACQIIHLDSKLKLIDSPGICFSKEKSTETSMTVGTILARVPKSTLMNLYGIGDYPGGNEDEFLGQIAIKFGQLKKGGIPNPEAAKQKVLHDWNTGVIKFFTEPPEESIVTQISSSTFVSTLSAPFSLDNFGTKPAQAEAADEVEMKDADAEAEVQSTSMTPRRSTRNSSKQVSFSVTSQLIDAKGRKKLKPAKNPSSDDTKKSSLHGLLATKKPMLKKLRKSKKKIMKKGDGLAKILDDVVLK